ncbi:MAG: formylglycine-generating enzyme family protein, partial [Symploca sp. SIO2E6]|nr:formylglycine-generating enzyme family protein [Symploca sp. SIO2E6]
MSPNSLQDVSTQRPNYYDSKCLLDNDFYLQHHYIIDRQRYQTANLQVSGIVQGLTVTKKGDNTVTISKGSAIDSSGRLIVLPQNEVYTVNKSGSLYIKYQETTEGKQQQKNIDNSYTRWEDTYTFEIFSSSPALEEGWLKLAELTFNRRVVSTEPTVLEYSGICLPTPQPQEPITLSYQSYQDTQLPTLEGSLTVGDLTVDKKLKLEQPIDSNDVEIVHYSQVTGLANYITSKQAKWQTDIDKTYIYYTNNVSIGIRENADRQLKIAGDLLVGGDAPEIAFSSSRSSIVHQDNNKIIWHPDKLKFQDQNSIILASGSSNQLVIDQNQVNIGQDASSLQVTGELTLPEGVSINQFYDGKVNDSMDLEKMALTENAVTLLVQQQIRVKEFDLGGNVTLAMVYIPAGEFDMGDLHGIDGGHVITFTESFWIGQYPVTQEQYQQIVGDNPSGVRDDLTKPVESVTWEDAKDFCTALNENSELNEQWGTYQFRLPSESEWEYACRAGTTTLFYFGDEEAQLGDYAWFKENSGGGTHSIVEEVKQPNEWNVYDTLGNVWEWCEDTY